MSLGCFGEMNLPFANFVVKLLSLPLKLAQEIHFRFPEFGKHRIKLVNHGGSSAEAADTLSFATKVKGKMRAPL